MLAFLRQNVRDALPFLTAMLKREVTNKYQQSLIGFVWLFIQPLFLLFVYYFVFAFVFNIRFDANAVSEQSYGFVAFLAVGLWPWSAFAEGINAATSSIDKHKSVLQKIALPAHLLVWVEVLVPHIIHGLGFIFVLLTLATILGEKIAWAWLPMMMFFFALQCLFTLGLGLIFASMQVFLKDIAQLLQPLLMVLFYGSPVLYPPTVELPDNLMAWLRLNPLTGFINAYRATLLEGRLPSGVDVLSILIVTGLTGFIGLKLFRRLSVRFEDMY